MIIVGGYNVYPTEVEAVLFEHPAVKEAAVIGVPDERRWKQSRRSSCSSRARKPAREEMVDFCKERMAAYRVPRLIEFRQDLPKSLIGKVLRRELRR
jgi:long-chain acyl-CoA synthetase